jgi:hypothetical protein
VGRKKARYFKFDVLIVDRGFRERTANLQSNT